MSWAWLTLPDSFILCPLCFFFYLLYGVRPCMSWCMTDFARQLYSMVCIPCADASMADFARQLYSMVHVPCAVGLGAWLTLPDSFTLWCTSLVQLVSAWLTLPDSFTLWYTSLVQLVSAWLTLPTALLYGVRPLCSWSWCMADFARQLYSMVCIPCAGASMADFAIL